MSNCSDSNHTKILDNRRKASDELNLMDDLQKTPTKTEEGADQKEPVELKSESSLPKLPNKPITQSDNAVETNDDKLTCDDKMFPDILTKIQAYKDKSKQEKVEKSILIDECQIFNDFFNLIEKYETNFTDEDLLVVKKGLSLLMDVARTLNPDNVCTTDLADTKEIFYLYFKLLDSTVIQNYLKYAQIPDQLKLSYRFCVSRTLDVLRATCTHTVLGLNDPQRPVNLFELLSLMINYVKTYLQSLDLTVDPSPTDASVTKHFILRFMWDYSDKTIMVPDLIASGCLAIIIDGLAIICKIAEVNYDLRNQLTAIVYNISRHDDGIKQLNALKAADVIKTFQSDTKNVPMNTRCCMILALLSTPEQIKNDGNRMYDVLDKLLAMVRDASVSPNDSSGGFHLSEPLIVLVKLFNDDHTLNYIMEHARVDLHTSSSIEFFINLLIKYHSTIDNEGPLTQATSTALVNILWSISFHGRYRQKLKNANIEFKELIKNLTNESNEKITSNQYVPQYLENIRKSAEGLLFNIDELVQPENKQLDAASTILDKNKKPMIMISYSHADTQFCTQLYNEIVKRGYDIWIDFDFIKTGDLWETIAVGMKQSRVIVCLMSESYVQSKSCRLEAIYALDKLQGTKSVIPVFLRKHELPPWLGKLVLKECEHEKCLKPFNLLHLLLDIRTADLKYVRFRDSNQMENDKLNELIGMIEHLLPTTVPHTTLSLHPPVLPVHHDQVAQAKPTVVKLENQDISAKSGSNLFSSSTTTDQSLYPEKPIEQWNENDISKWFQHNDILTELRDLCQFKDGCELLDYAKIFLDTEKLQYHMYSDEFLRRDNTSFGKRPLLLHEFTKFSNALRKLEKFKK